MRSALELQAELIQEAVHPLREVVDSLHGWMLEIGGFLEQAEAVLDELSRMPADPLVLPVVGKLVRSSEPSWLFLSSC
jgi:signal transduction histidine kinase